MKILNGCCCNAGAQEAAAVNGVSGQQQAPVSPATGRRFRSAAPRPPVIFSGNHIVRPLRLRNTDAEQDRIRRKVHHTPLITIHSAAFMQG